MILGHKRQLASLVETIKGTSTRTSYLFYGEEQIGKRLSAVSLTRFLEESALPTEERSGAPLLDAHMISPQGEAIGIAAIRGAKAFLMQAPARSRFRTLVIDDAHCLTGEAANAALKMTEEPPPHSLLFFIARSPELLLPTLASRLQKIYFAPLVEGEIASWLHKTQGVSKARAAHVAKVSRGKPGLAYDLLFDEATRARMQEAKELMERSGKVGERYLKDLVAREDFTLDAFLRGMLLHVTTGGVEVSSRFWHAIMKLRSESERFSPNPRIQLRHLLTTI